MNTFCDSGRRRRWCEQSTCGHARRTRLLKCCTLHTLHILWTYNEVETKWKRGFRNAVLSTSFILCVLYVRNAVLPTPFTFFAEHLRRRKENEASEMLYTPHPSEREFFIDNLLLWIHYIIVMKRWTGPAPCDFDFPFPGILIYTFLSTSLTFSERMPHLLNSQRLPFDLGKSSGALHQLQFPQLWKGLLGSIDHDPVYNQVQNSLAQNWGRSGRFSKCGHITRA